MVMVMVVMVVVMRARFPLLIATVFSVWPLQHR
jgi:hypothetical protein